MLRSLQVKNYVLIDSLDIEFGAGLVIITGQTGAGKSILLGALGLLTGAKADSTMVGESGDNCIVEGTFSPDPSLQPFFEEHDLAWDPDEVVIRRVLGRSGRSRSFVNDEPVQIAVLQGLSSKLIDIHSQNENAILKDKSFQLLMLDRYASCGDLLKECSSAWARRQAASAELSRIVARIASLSSEKDYNRAAFEQLDKARLREGELEELEAEQKQLANAEEIKENLYGSEAILSGSDDRASVDSMLKEASRSLDRTARYLSEAEALAGRLESVRMELSDVLSEIGSLESSVDISPERLEQVEDRMSLLYDLMKKHSVANIGELIAVRDALGGTLYDSESLESRKEELRAELAKAEKDFDAAASALHQKRSAAAAPFAKAVRDLLRRLELDRSAFDVQVLPSQPSSSGKDSVLFRFSSTGRAPEDVAKVASGGEVSRIMLSLKAMMARYSSMPSLVFDEIDTGVSGSAADSMGSLICDMGQDMQVFAITHLPQVAAKGGDHYLVSKKTSPDGRAETTINKITGENRVMEIARMLSGSGITPQAVANARALLSAE